MGKAVSFTYDDGRRVGSHEIKAGMVHVTTEFGTKATQVGGSPPLAIARLIAGELMRAAKIK